MPWKAEGERHRTERESKVSEGKTALQVSCLGVDDLIDSIESFPFDRIDQTCFDEERER